MNFNLKNIINLKNITCPACKSNIILDFNTAYCRNKPIIKDNEVNLNGEEGYYHFFYSSYTGIDVINIKIDDLFFKYIDSSEFNKSYICFNTRYFEELNNILNQTIDPIDKCIEELFPHVFEFHINFIDEFPYISKETLEKIKSKKDLYIFI